MTVTEYIGFPFRLAFMAFLSPFALLVFILCATFWPNDVNLSGCFQYLLNFLLHGNE